MDANDEQEVGAEVGRGDATPEPAPDPPGRGLVRRILRWVLISLAVLVSAAVFLAVLPVSTAGLDARPRPADNLDAARARLAAWEQEMTGDVYEPCRSRLLLHEQRTEVAVVLFHGLTNCPEQFVEFGEQLFAAGANVVILRAPHHGLADGSGTSIGGVGSVAGLTAAELRRFADEAVDIAAGVGDEVRVLGLSMGGVLAAWVGQFRDDVTRAVAVAPAMSIPRAPSAVTTGFVNLFHRLPNLNLPGTANLDHAYAGESTKGLVATFLMARATQHSARRQGPAAGEVVVVLNPNDDQVDNVDVRRFAQRWNREDGRVDVVRLPDAGLPHDVIDPGQPAGNPDLVYPILRDLLERGAADGVSTTP